MIDYNKRSLDLFEEQPDHATEPILSNLDHAYATAPPPHLGAAMDHVIYAHMTAVHGADRAAPTSFWWRRASRSKRARLPLISLTAALLVGLSGVAGYLRWSSPTTVSAQTVLRRAAAIMHMAPNEAAHVTYSVTVSGKGMAATDGNAAGGLTGTADVWIQTDANDAPTLSAQTLTMDRPGMTSRYIQRGQQIYAYNPEMRGANVITLNATRGRPSWLLPADVFDGAGVTQELSTLAARSPQRVQLLPRQTLDGHSVDVIEVDGWTNRPAQRTTFYFDAQSYILRGFDATSQDPSYPTPSWQARLRDYATMPAASVPSGTFTLNAPATAQVHLPDIGAPGAFGSFMAVFSATCHGGTDVNPKALLRSGQSLLAACRASVPSVTEAGLVAALTSSYETTLDAAVASGQITPAQATDGRARLQAWLTIWITSPVT